ncbi:hypothetical protein ADICYQ_5383 [Cyclobacterium qasimii M12-11B]|uniref:Uncharacterized protein n=1 Tax=Cyclobacterium qasimii M12-11B TaxID=641524 RepID=S7V783_9BACT|nr:hypothetical protein ADICYQ_5383 [Cyclobacterium qasimii M12-11B]
MAAGILFMYSDFLFIKGKKEAKVPVIPADNTLPKPTETFNR